MKKVCSLCLCLVLGLSMSGCSSSDKKEVDKTEEKEVKKDTYGIGETVLVEDINITVNATRIGEGIFGDADEGKEYFVLDITLENIGEEEATSSSIICYQLKDADGRKKSLAIGADTEGSLDGTIAPNEKLTGEIAFQAEPETELVLTFRPGLGDSVKIKVR